jgi:multidrug efflux system outer membrane protein
MRTAALLVLAGGVLAGCAVGPTYQRPQLAVPDRVRGGVTGSEAASLADQAWWGIFRDDALQSLIAEALADGFDVRLAAWRVQEAQALAGISRSQLYPELQASAGWTRSRASTFNSVNPPKPVDLADVNLGLSWELDLWGRIRRLDQAALAQYLASEEARRGVALSLVAEVATSYFELRELDLRLEIATRTAAAFRETRDLFNRRLAGGTASALETASAEASLAATAANIPNLERQIAAKENELSLLLGRLPGEIKRGAALDAQFLPPEIPPGLPADLLERRPDLREAEQLLIGANAEVGVATADMFPTITLTGALGGVAPKVTELLQPGRTWSVGGGLLTPVVQAGRLKHLRRAAVAQWEQARAGYEESVTSAFAEVSTALVAYSKLAEAEEQQARAVEAYREAVRLANLRYVAGLSDYLEVLQAQQQLYPAENILAETRFERLATLVELYKALGGGWKLSDRDFAAPPPVTPGGG